MLWRIWRSVVCRKWRGWISYCKLNSQATIDMAAVWAIQYSGLRIEYEHWLNSLSQCFSLPWSMYPLLTKHEVNMVGYWPHSFFFFAFLWTKMKWRSIKMQKKKKKKRTRAISSHLDQTSLVNKGFIVIMAKGLHERIYGNKVGNLVQARWAHLVHSGSQSEHRIHFILHTRGASHIIKICTALEIARKLKSNVTCRCSLTIDKHPIKRE